MRIPVHVSDAVGSLSISLACSDRSSACLVLSDPTGDWIDKDAAPRLGGTKPMSLGVAVLLLSQSAPVFAGTSRGPPRPARASIY